VVIEDFERCYRAVHSRDARFDGWFFTAVTSTHIYCRPSCPALTPKRTNVVFYPSAAAAQGAGFRACLRCRPDAAPGSPEWNTRADVVARAMRLIADGAVDRDGVAGLADRLGYSGRQLHRLLVAEVGTGAIALARAQRAQTARLLIETTDLAFSDVTFAAGFASIRQFNETIQEIFARTPTELRRSAGGRAQGGGGAVSLRLAYRQPFDASSVFDFLAWRCVPGIEEFDDGTYRRSLRLDHGEGVVALEPGEGCVAATFHLRDLRDLTAAVSRCRRLLDLDADPVAVDTLLGTDPVLAPLVARRPGRRMPGSVDGAELAVRAVIGQQVSVLGARNVAGQLVQSAGEKLENPVGGVTHLFPTPVDLVDLAADDPGAFAMPGSRRQTLVTLNTALAEGRLRVDPGEDRSTLEAQLLELPGIGPWTTAYIAMRALGDPDAFMPTDLGIKRAIEALGLNAHPKAIMAMAEEWRPWRAYAMAHLWASLVHPIETKKQNRKEST
jgi:AraC family transcriptional regulator of adaptative response / DNA-3-methyladenine glycosylase II